MKVPTIGITISNMCEGDTDTYYYEDNYSIAYREILLSEYPYFGCITSNSGMDFFNELSKKIGYNSYVGFYEETYKEILTYIRDNELKHDLWML